MLQFPYQPVPLIGPSPPSLPPTATVHWRPFVPVTIIGTAGRSRYFKRGLVDPGSDDTVFPLAIEADATQLPPLNGATPRASSWRRENDCPV